MNFDTCDSSLPFCKRHHAISLLLANDPVLLSRFFIAGKRSVDVGKAAELRDSFALPAAKRTLIQLALAIWTETAIVVFSEVYLQLDEVRYESFLLALEFLGGAASRYRCSCRICDDYRIYPPFVRESLLNY